MVRISRNPKLLAMRDAEVKRLRSLEPELVAPVDVVRRRGFLGACLDLHSPVHSQPPARLNIGQDGFAQDRKNIARDFSNAIAIFE